MAVTPVGDIRLVSPCDRPWIWLRRYARHMRVARLVTLAIVVSLVTVVSGCGTSGAGGGSADVLSETEREPAARLAVPALRGAGMISIGVPSARPTVLNLWASWCGPCREEMPAVQRFARSHPGVRVVGVAINDAPDAAREFATEVGVRFPLGVDQGNRVADAYGVSGLPMTLIFDRRGRVAATWAGPITAADLERLTSAVRGGA